MEYHKATDNIDQNILDLIHAENDPGKRANLLILQAMAINLGANTMALNALSTEIYDHKKEFKAHREEFMQHIETEVAIVSQIKGGSRVFMYFMSVIQAIVFTAFTYGMHDYSQLSAEFHAQQVSIAAQQAKVDSFIKNADKNKK
jgi:hypothetical protein